MLPRIQSFYGRSQEPSFYPVLYNVRLQPRHYRNLRKSYSSCHKNTVEQGGYAATCGADGREPNIYCNDCQKIVKYGQAIPATEQHTGGTATCCAKATCSVCGATYGELDASNHAGGTEVRNASATYTGDTYCLGCNVKIKDGESPVKGEGKLVVIDGGMSKACQKQTGI